MSWKCPEYGVPYCPICQQKPTIRNINMPLWGHFCLSGGMNTYWSFGGFWSPNLKFAEGVISREAATGKEKPKPTPAAS